MLFSVETLGHMAEVGRILSTTTPPTVWQSRYEKRFTLGDHPAQNFEMENPMPHSVSHSVEMAETLAKLAAQRYGVSPTQAPALSTPDRLQAAQQAVSRAIAAVGALYNDDGRIGVAEALLAVHKAQAALGNLKC